MCQEGTPQERSWSGRRMWAMAGSWHQKDGAAEDGASFFGEGTEGEAGGDFGDGGVSIWRRHFQSEKL